MDVMRQLKGEPVGALPLLFANTKTDRKILDDQSLPNFGIGEPAPEEVHRYFHDYGAAQAFVTKALADGALSGARKPAALPTKYTPSPAAYIPTKETIHKGKEEARLLQAFGFVAPWFVAPQARDALGRVVVEDGLVRSRKPDPLILTDDRFESAVRSGLLIPLSKPSQKTLGKSQKTEQKHAIPLKCGVLASDLTAQCEGGRAPVLNLDVAGCLALRAAIPSSLLLCFLPGQMVDISNACKDQVLTPEAVELIKHAKTERGLFDEVILVHSAHAAFTRLSKAVERAQRRHHKKTSVKYGAGERDPVWNAEKGVFRKEPSPKVTWVPGGDVDWPGHSVP